MSVNPGELYTNTLQIGALLFTSRGIAEIQAFYNENAVDKVRFWLHTVNPADGVTATGEALLMSTTPDKLQEWINHFPRDMAERKKSVVMLPLDARTAILENIQNAENQGPKAESRKNLT